MKENPKSTTSGKVVPGLWGVSSRYLWHGLPFSDGLVVWPSVWVSAKGLTIDLSANLDPNYQPRLNEIDLFVGYERAIGRLTLNGAFSRYTYRELEGDPGSTVAQIFPRWNRVADWLKEAERFSTAA